MSDKQEPVEELDGQLSIDDTTPDPGNSPPEAWTADLDDDELDQAADAVNTIAVDLPEAGA